MKARIIAPSSACIDSELKLNQTIELLTNHDFEVIHSLRLFSERPLPYYANSKAERLADLRDAILSDDDIIWAFRGGYGAGEIIENCMDLAAEPLKKKILIGFSDITAIHLLFNQIFHMPSLHASVLTSLLSYQAHHIEDIKRILGGEKHILRIKPLNHVAKNIKIEGKITGGNLCVFETMIGTKLHPDTNNKILLLEDVSEPGYKISRMLNHLENAGIFSGLKACILGDFIGTDSHINYALDQFIECHPELPIYRLASGHGAINHPVILGANVVIENGFLEGCL